MTTVIIGGKIPQGEVELTGVPASGISTCQCCCREDASVKHTITKNKTHECFQISPADKMSIKQATFPRDKRSQYTLYPKQDAQAKRSRKTRSDASQSFPLLLPASVETKRGPEHTELGGFGWVQEITTYGQTNANEEDKASIHTPLSVIQSRGVPFRLLFLPWLR